MSGKGNITAKADDQIALWV